MQRLHTGGGGVTLDAPRTLADLREVPGQAGDPAVLTEVAQAWRAERVRRFNTLPANLRGRLTGFVEALTQEERCRGALIGANAVRQQERLLSRQQNSRQGELIQQLANENRALRLRANDAEHELIALRATLPGIERVVRHKIIAASAFSYPPLPRLAPRSACLPRYLSNDAQVQRVARRIEEFMASEWCFGYARKEKLMDHLLPEVPASTFETALTHLLLSRRIAQSTSGAFRLRAGRPS